MFDESGNALIGDMCYARIAEDDYMTRIGSPQHVAPEVAVEESKAQQNKSVAKYDFSADVWSAGVLAYTLLAGKYPFNGTF